MKYIVISIILIFTLSEIWGQQNQNPLQTQMSLAITYYNAKDYEKAMPLLYQVYEISKNESYFRYYIDCLLNMERYSEAEAQIQKELKKQNPEKPEFYIHWGHVLKVEDKLEEANSKYLKAIEIIPPNRINYLIAANAFIGWGEYEFAKQTYLKGKEVLAPESFSYELARIYLYLRDYENMMEEYLNLLHDNEDQLSRVQSSLASAMRLDIDDDLRNQFRNQVLKRIQAEPDVIGYNRLLIWFFLQEKKFSSALRQSVALDKRTGNEDIQIVQLGNMALNNKNYDDAQKAFQYLMDKGENTPFFRQAFAYKIHASYLRFTNEFSNDKVKGEQLANEFKEGLDYLGITVASLNLLQENAHLLAFYLNKPEEALALLNKGLEIPRLQPEQTGLLKTEKADIYVYSNDPWEATLIYSQVIEDNKTNSLGDDVKLKKARLSYYMGNFDWAKAQLDVLKASTSKLIANDALELSLLIGNNLNLDTTAVPLTMFAKADFLFFQNKNDEAMTVLNGLLELFPYHTLVDDILYRKAKIEIEKQQYLVAAENLQKIVDEFSYDLLGDDALYLLAELYNYNLNEKEKARDLYKDMLIQHPGSIYTEESRKKFRELLELYPEKNIDQRTKEELFMDGINQNELE